MSGIHIDFQYIINNENDSLRDIKSITFDTFKDLYCAVYNKTDIGDLTEEECKKRLENLDRKDKIRLFNKVLDKVKNGNCSVFSDNKNSFCLSSNVMEKWVFSILTPSQQERLSEYKSSKEFNKTDYDKILFSIIKDYYHFDSEKDLITQISENKDLYVPLSLLKEIKKYYKPNGPLGKEWLSDLEISNVIEQFLEEANNKREKGDKVRFGGVYPIDFMLYPDLYNIVSYINEDFKTDTTNNYLSLILNHDKHNQSGSHWISIYIDKKNYIIYYYDSVAEKPKREHKEFFKTLNKIFNKEFKVVYNPNKQQTSGGDCGVYSICFTVSMMNSKNIDKTFKDFINLTLKPSFVNSLRHFIFSK